MSLLFRLKPRSKLLVARRIFSSEIGSSSDKELLKKEDIAQEVARSHDLPAQLSQNIVKTVFDTISKALEQKKTVSLEKFGIFDTAHSKERQYRDIHTKEMKTTAAKERVRFKASKTLKDKVNVPE